MNDCDGQLRRWLKLIAKASLVLLVSGFGQIDCCSYRQGGCPDVDFSPPPPPPPPSCPDTSAAGLVTINVLSHNPTPNPVNITKKQRVRWCNIETPFAPPPGYTMGVNDHRMVEGDPDSTGEPLDSPRFDTGIILPGSCSTEATFCDVTVDTTFEYYCKNQEWGHYTHMRDYPINVDVP